MKTQSLLNTVGSTLLLLGLTVAAVPSAQAQGKVTQRPIADWLDAQGTLLPAGSAPFGSEPLTPYLFGWGNNPDINGDGVADGPRYYLWYDYAGVLSRPTSTGGGTLGPKSITGTVIERPLRDGLAQVTVSLAVQDAVIWVVDGTLDPSAADWGTLPVVFGHREDQLANDPSLEPALVDVQFTVTILNEVGAPLPDLIDSLFSGRFLGFHIVLNARGPLSAAFGVPEGTPGALHWGKPGTLTVPANPHADNGAASLFPDDQFHLFQIGNE
jgi:hypothetical protein